MRSARYSLVCSLLFIGNACAVGVPADPPPLSTDSAVRGAAGSASLVSGAAGGSGTIFQDAGQSTGSVVTGSSADAGGRNAAGSPANTAACQKLACFDVFDCVFVYLGNQCAFTKCESGTCR